jgi:hypothetical protein
VFGFFHREKAAGKSGLSRITERGTRVALESSSEPAGRRRDGGEVIMDKVILFLLIGVVGWWLGNTAGPVGYEPLLETEPSGLDMIFGIAGSSAGGYLLLYTFAAR